MPLECKSRSTYPFTSEAMAATPLGWRASSVDRARFHERSALVIPEHTATADARQGEERQEWMSTLRLQDPSLWRPGGRRRTLRGRSLCMESKNYSITS